MFFILLSADGGAGLVDRIPVQTIRTVFNIAYVTVAVDVQMTVVRMGQVLHTRVRLARGIGIHAGIGYGR